MLSSVLFAFPLLDHVPTTNGGQERLELLQQVLLGDPGLPVQQEEQLAFHEVDFRQREAEPVVALDGGVAGPVLVLRAGVVEVLRGQDQAGQEDAVDGASHSLGHGGQPGSQPGQIHQ